MSENTTTSHTFKKKAYLNDLANETERTTAKDLLTLFTKTTGKKPALWGNMVGFGSYHYKYDSGREGDFLATGFAMRKSGPTIYIMPGYQDYSDILKDLGPHKLGKSCLYIKRLEDIDLKVLEKLIKAGLKDLQKKYPVS
ncbi:DUF1801 domain-containing protein [Candidatus Pacebacteria bacterium]|nr:DUF1801 domain-containing protein [Candidatus Paceibacterota bacterium]